MSPEAAPSEALAFLSERYKAVGIDHAISLAKIREEDWANEWKQYFKPLEIGERLVIRPTWEKYDNRDGRAVLSIDPGMAFGTGGHATTRLCLEVMEHFITPETNFLDLGCGSGILSIAALLLGANSATGVDIDALAVKTAQENGALNGFGPPRYQILQGNLADRVQGSFQVIAANIVADVILIFCPQVAAYLKSGGVFIASGIIDSREKEVVDALEKYGFQKVNRIVAGGKERYHSVYNGLHAIEDCTFVYIHDGARPFLTQEILLRAREAVREYHACVVGMPVKDTIKISDKEGFGVQTPDRSLVWQVQTRLFNVKIT